MARYTTLSFTSASIGANTSLVINQAILSDIINVYKIKVTQGTPGGTTQVSIFKKSTALAADLIYNTVAFAGDLVDPVNDDGSNPVTEVNEGFLFPYEDLDAGKKLHIKIFNNDSVGKTFAIEIVYEEMVISVGTLFTDFTDTKFWVPVYPPAPWGTLAFNGSKQAVLTSNANAPNKGGAGGMSARFRLYPDATTFELKIRAKFINMNLPLRAALNQDQRWGLMLGTIGITYNGAAIHVKDTSNTVEVLTMAIDSGVLADLEALAIGTIAASLELRLTIGADPSGTFNFGSLLFEYNIDGAGFVTLTPSTSLQFKTAIVAGLRPFIGVMANGANSNTFGTLSEFEVIEGLISLGQ